MEGMARGINFSANISMTHKLNLWLPTSIKMQVENIEYIFTYSNDPDSDGNLISTIERIGD
jgi:hypothetical protein